MCIKLLKDNFMLTNISFFQIKSVDDFVNNVNLSLKQKQDNERLKGIMARIESYDVVVSKEFRSNVAMLKGRFLMYISACI